MRNILVHLFSFINKLHIITERILWAYYTRSIMPSNIQMRCIRFLMRIIINRFVRKREIEVFQNDSWRAYLPLYVFFFFLFQIRVLYIWTII